MIYKNSMYIEGIILMQETVMKKLLVLMVFLFLGLQPVFSQNVVGNSSYRDPTGTGRFKSNEPIAFMEHFSTASDARAEYNNRRLVNQEAGKVEQFNMLINILVKVSSSGRITNNGIMTIMNGMIHLLIIDWKVIAVGVPDWLYSY
jgi:hypothetical protein